MGVLGLAATLAVRAAEPPVLRLVTVQTADVPAFVHEIEALQALYNKQGLAVAIDVYRGTYAGANTGNVVVQIRLANLAALARMNEMTRTQPDLVGEMKKIGGLQKIVLEALYEQVSAPLAVRAAGSGMLRVLVLQTADVPTYVHEIEALRALYQKQGLPATIEAYQVTYAGPIVDVALVQVWVANLAVLARMDEMTRTQPDLVAAMKKIGGLQKVLFDGLYDKLTP